MLNVSVLTDPGFCPHSLNKYASIMACGNGYMGIRATHEEDYTQQTRGMYLAGLYHRAGRNETTELVNLPDIIGIDVELDGVNFTLLSGEILEWQRELAFANGELRETLSSGEPSFCVAGPVALSGHAAFHHAARCRHARRAANRH